MLPKYNLKAAFLLHLPVEFPSAQCSVYVQKLNKHTVFCRTSANAGPLSIYGKLPTYLELD